MKIPARARQCRRERKGGWPVWQQALKWGHSTCLCGITRRGFSDRSFFIPNKGAETRLSLLQTTLLALRANCIGLQNGTRYSSLQEEDFFSQKEKSVRLGYCHSCRTPRSADSLTETRSSQSCSEVPGNWNVMNNAIAEDGSESIRRFPRFTVRSRDSSNSPSR